MKGLEKYRNEIDLIDEELIKLFAKRFRIVEKIGEYKKLKGIELMQKTRFEDLLKARKKLAKELGIKEIFIENIWNQIHKYSLDLEK